MLRHVTKGIYLNESIGECESTYNCFIWLIYIQPTDKPKGN